MLTQKNWTQIIFLKKSYCFSKTYFLSIPDLPYKNKFMPRRTVGSRSAYGHFTFTSFVESAFLAQFFACSCFRLRYVVYICNMHTYYLYRCCAALFSASHISHIYALFRLAFSDDTTMQCAVPSFAHQTLVFCETENLRNEKSLNAVVGEI